MSNSYIQDFGTVFNLKNLIKKPTCFKNLERSTDIDHILTNHNRFWQNSSAFETRLLDFHTVTYTVLKIYGAKQKARVVQYKSYKNSNNEFRRDMSKELFLTNLQKDEVTKFKYLNFKLLSSDAPLKIFRIGGGGGGQKTPF